MSVSKTRGFLAGVAGGAVAVAVLFAYRYATSMPTLQEALAERMIRLLPYQVFALFLATLQHLAKPLGLVMAVVASLVGFGLGGVLYAGIAGRTRWSPLRGAIVTAVVAWVVLTFGLLPLIEGGVLGAPLTTVVTDPAVPMALASIAYALVLASLARVAVRPRVGVGTPTSRGGSAPSGAGRAASMSRRAWALGDGAAFGGDLAFGRRVGRRHLLRRSAFAVAGVAVGTRLAAWAA